MHTFTHIYQVHETREYQNQAADFHFGQCFYNLSQTDQGILKQTSCKIRTIAFFQYFCTTYPELHQCYPTKISIVLLRVWAWPKRQGNPSNLPAAERHSLSSPRTFKLHFLKRQRGTWVAWLVKYLTLDLSSGLHPRAMRFKPHMGSHTEHEAYLKKKDDDDNHLIENFQLPIQRA